MVLSPIHQSFWGKAVPSKKLSKNCSSLLQKGFEKRDVLPLPSWASWQCAVGNGPEKINWTLHLRDKGWDFIPNNLVTQINLCPQTL